jgi:amidase
MAGNGNPRGDKGEVTGIDRRQFLLSAAAIAVATVGVDVAARPVIPPGVRLRVPTALKAQPAVFALNEITVDDLQRGMQRGHFTARAVTEMYLGRIDDIDRAGPSLRSIIETNPDALGIAESLDEERKAGRIRGPLHGVPVLVKDVIDTGDRMHTTAGSLALVGSFARKDAFIVARLREAGAIILGKTNLSEWSNVRSTRSTSGWSARGGLCRNPYVLDRTACGSSSGAASSVASNLGALAIGVETDGSIACPSSANCLVGIKPTVGLLSRGGLIPVSYSQDTAGPMARTVKDAAILLGALTGIDSRDPATEASRGKALTDYMSALDKGALKGARIGVIRRPHELDSALEAVLDHSVGVLRSAGAIIVDEVAIPSVDDLQRPETFVLVCEFKDAIAEYLATRGPEEYHKSLADLIEFNKQNADVELQWFGQEWFEASEETKGRATPEYKDALEACHVLSRTRGLDRVLAEHRLDAVVGIAASAPFASDMVNGDRPIVKNSSLSAVSGYPRITVPAGFIRDLPVGLSIMGPAWSEAKLLGLAYAFEQENPVRRAPQFIPTVIVDR